MPLASAYVRARTDNCVRKRVLQAICSGCRCHRISVSLLLLLLLAYNKRVIDGAFTVSGRGHWLRVAVAPGWSRQCSQCGGDKRDMGLRRAYVFT